MQSGRLGDLNGLRVGLQIEMFELLDGVVECVLWQDTYKITLNGT